MKNWLLKRHDLTIKTKLILMLVFLAGFMVVSFVMQGVIRHKIMGEFNHIREHDIKLILMAEAIKSDISAVHQQVLADALLAATEPGTEPTLDESQRATIEAQIAKLGQFAQKYHDDRLATLVNNLKIRFEAFWVNGSEMAWIFSDGDLEEGTLAVRAVDSIGARMYEEIDTLNAIAQESLQNGAATFVGSLKKVQKLRTWGVIISAIVIVVATLLFMRDITQRLSRLLVGTRAFAQGDYTHRIPVIGKDELAQVGRSFNEMAASIDRHDKNQRNINRELDAKVKEKTAELEKSLNRVEQVNNIIMDSIHYASRIQHSFLPQKEKLDKLIREYFVIWDQRDVVGGDFYWVEETEEGFILAVIDCTGHGVPGALMTMIAVPILERLVNEQKLTDPGIILSEMNRAMKMLLNQDEADPFADDGLDGAVCHIDRNKGTLQYAGARTPLFYLESGKVEEIKGDKAGIGYKGTSAEFAFKTHEVPLKKGLSFYLVTDGMTEQVGGDNRRVFGKRRLKALIEANHHRPKSEQRTQIMASFTAYMGDEPRRDDLTCVGFKIAG